MCLAMLVINIYVQKRKENNDKRLFLLRSDQKSVLEREREKKQTRTKVLNKEEKKEHQGHFHACLISCFRHKTRMIYTSIYEYWPEQYKN